MLDGIREQTKWSQVEDVGFAGMIWNIEPDRTIHKACGVLVKEMGLITLEQLLVHSLGHGSKDRGHQPMHSLAVALQVLYS